LFESTTIEESELQKSNTLSPRLVTLDGMVIEDRDVQLKNAPYNKLVTVFGMVMEERELQLLNALIPIVITLFGILITLNNLDDHVCTLNPSNIVIVPVDDVNVYVAPLSAVSNTILIL
jgi:hypothetical protein